MEKFGAIRKHFTRLLAVLQKDLNAMNVTRRTRRGCCRSPMRAHRRIRHARVGRTPGQRGAADQHAFQHRLRMNALARAGKWSPEAERAG